MDLETYYRKIHRLWINIDRNQKQPINCCDKGVEQFRNYSNSKRLIKFLTGLNQEYDSIRREIVKKEPALSVEAAYGWVKTEAARRRIMPPTSQHPPTKPTMKLNRHLAEESDTGLLHRTRDHHPEAARHHRHNPRPPAGREMKLTPQNCCVPTVGNKSILGRLVSRGSATQNGGKNDIRQKPFQPRRKSP